MRDLVVILVLMLLAYLFFQYSGSGEKSGISSIGPQVPYVGIEIT